jgi:AraC family transcriptional regulator
MLKHELAVRSTCERESRAQLVNVSIGLVEDLRREGVRPERGPEGFCDAFQICLPYRGLFVWHVGRDEIVGDSNQVIFVRGGESYRMSAPMRAGYAELIITPDIELLSEIAGVNRRQLFEHPLFTRRSCRIDASLQHLRARFLHWARFTPGPASLQAEEAVIALIRRALQRDDSREPPSGAASARLIRRTKEFLEATLSSRVQLADIAREVGVSPAYLTDLFTRVEGLSLYQYVLQLRVGRALLELPYADDLTDLALGLGFSSHSHFSYVFRRTCRCTPSEFRRATRRGAAPLDGVAAFTPARTTGRHCRS